MILLNFRSLYRAQYVQFHTASKRSKWLFEWWCETEAWSSRVDWVDSARREKNGKIFWWQKFSQSNWFCQGDEVCFDGWGTHQSASKQKKQKTGVTMRLLFPSIRHGNAMKFWCSQQSAGSEVAFQETQCCFLKLWEWIASSSRHSLTSRHVAPQSSVGSLVLLLYTWSCLPVSTSSGLTCEADGYIVNHLARHASVRRHVVRMGERVQMSDIESESSFSRKPWGIDFPELLDGNIQINMNHGSDMNRKSVGWFPSNDFCTSPQVLPAPAGWCPQWRIQVTISAVSGYHMSHANTCHMLSDITFVCGERLDDTLKTIPIFFWTFLPQSYNFQKLWSWPTSPQHRCLGFSGSNGVVYRELIEAAKPIWLRSNLRLAGELKFALL